MKKRAIIVTILILMTLCSCGKNNINPSNISIGEFENDLRGFAIDESKLFDYEEKGDEIYFYGGKNDTGYDIEINGIADSSQKVESISAKLDDIDTEILKNDSRLRNIITAMANGDTDDLSVPEVRASVCFTCAMAFYGTINENNNDLDINILFDMFTSYEILNVDGWKMYAVIDDDQSFCTIKCEYCG